MDFWCLAPVGNLQAASLIPFFYSSCFVLLPSPVLSVLSLSAFGPFSCLIFPLNLHFQKGRLFCGCSFVFERLDQYFSWWYVQHVLPYMALVLLLAFIYFEFAIIFVHSLFLKKSIGYWNAWPNTRWYQLLTVFAFFFFRSDTEGTNFQIMFINILLFFSFYCIQLLSHLI